MISRFPIQAFACALALNLVPGLVSAAPQASAADEDALKFDQALQALKEETLDVRARELGAEDQLLYPPTTRLTLYFSVPEPGLLVKTLAISVDGGMPVQIDYQDDDGKLKAVRLQSSHGLQTLLKINAAPGPHHLSAHVTSAFERSDAKTPPIVSDLEIQFLKDELPAELELSLGRPGVGERPELSLKQWRVAP